MPERAKGIPTVRKDRVVALEGIEPALETATLMSVEMLMYSNPIAFYELVQLSRDRNHSLFGNTYDVLLDLGLVQGNGQPHDAIRQIVLAHTRGDGPELEFSMKEFDSEDE
jgi:hypothetical protein